MKRTVFTFMAFIIFVINVLGQVENGRFIQINANGEKKTMFLNDIDSITYNFVDDTYSQIIWIGGKEIVGSINEIDSVLLFSSSDIKCCEYKDENVQYGIIANTGDFIFLMNPEKTNNVLLLTVGNLSNLNDKFVCCQVDSFGIIRSMFLDEKNHAVFYEEDSIAIVSDDNMVTKAPYSIFENPNESNQKKIIRKAGGTTDSWLYKTFYTINTIRGIVNGKGVAARTGLYMGLKIADILDPDGADIRRMTNNAQTKDLIDLLLHLTEKMDKWNDKLTFGDMSIETLDSEKKKVNEYIIGCKINYSTADYLYSDYLHSYRITMKIDCPKRHWTEDRNDFSSDGIVKFDLIGLDLNTEYSYKPRLDIVVYNPNLNDFVTISEMLKRSGLKGYDFGNIPPFTTRYLIGTTKSFKTGYPSCTTGKIVSKTDKSAVIKCSYTDADCFECGVIISSENGTKSFTTSSEDGERQVNLSGLIPSTTYNYWAYIDIYGILINGEVKSFTTDSETNDNSSTYCPNGNHPHFIDLGLQSGIKWACCNVGASKPEQEGGRYAWGETSEKDEYTWATYIHCDGSAKTCHDIGYDIGNTSYDVAVSGGGRMPKFSAFTELKSCQQKTTIINGVSGTLFTGPNGNSIFMPSLDLWASTASTNNYHYAQHYSYSISEVIWGGINGGNRCYGRHVRAIKE